MAVCGGGERYEFLEKLGHGGNGTVYKARVATAAGAVVAVKKIPPYRYSSQEATILRALLPRHPNIIQLLDEFTGKQEHACLVFEFVEHDLATLLTQQSRGVVGEFTSAEVQAIARELLSGLHHLSTHGILHRDIKPSNVLLQMLPGGWGGVKISDFGLAAAKSDCVLKNQGTLWYRPPEVMFGLKHPVSASHVDIWAAGCVVAELVLLQPPLFSQGVTLLSQLECIFRVLGSPTASTWPDCDTLPNFVPPTAVGTAVGLQSVLGAKLERRFANGEEQPAREAYLQLLHQLLTLDPKQRITPQEALAHPFFALTLSNVRPTLAAEVVASSHGAPPTVSVLEHRRKQTDTALAANGFAKLPLSDYPLSPNCSTNSPSPSGSYSSHTKLPCCRVLYGKSSDALLHHHVENHNHAPAPFSPSLSMDGGEGSELSFLSCSASPAARKLNFFMFERGSCEYC